MDSFVTRGIRDIFAGVDSNSNLKSRHVLLSTMTLISAVQFYRFVRADYQKYLDLGPGGNPHNFNGYLRVTFARLFYAHKDNLQPPPPGDSTVYPTRGYLNQDFPRRPQPRPRTEGIAPHRQMNQRPPAEIYQSLSRAFHFLADKHPSLFHLGDSAFEKHGLAIFLRPGTAKDDPNAPTHAATSHLNPTYKDTGEVAHIHDLDTSMHITLHPNDVTTVIAAGWGERHPMAGIPVFGKAPVPAGFTMIYAPRTEQEVEIVVKAVKAGSWWVGGVDLEHATTSTPA